MSENPSPETPQSEQSFGAAPSAVETFGAAPNVVETIGAAPSAVETIGAAPSAVETFGSAPPAAAEPVPAPEPAPKKRAGGLLTLVLALVVVIAGAAAWYFFRGGAVKVAVGQCIEGSNTQETAANNIKVVDCAAASASFKVIQRVENTKNDGTLDSCPVDEREAGLWIGKKGEKGTLLCLVTVRK